MPSRYAAIQGRPNRRGPGKWHLVDLQLAPVNAFGNRRTLCGYVWGNPFVKDVPKVDCKVCIRVRSQED